MRSLLKLAVALALPLARGDAAALDALALVQRSVWGRPDYSFRTGDKVTLDGYSPKHPIVVIGYGSEPDRYNLQIEGHGIFSNVDGKMLQKAPPPTPKPKRSIKEVVLARHEWPRAARNASADKPNADEPKAALNASADAAGPKTPYAANASRYPYLPPWLMKAYGGNATRAYAAYAAYAAWAANASRNASGNASYFPYPPYYLPYATKQQQQAPKPPQKPKTVWEQMFEFQELQKKIAEHAVEERNIALTEQSLKRAQSKLKIEEAWEQAVDKPMTKKNQDVLEQSLAVREQYLAKQQVMVDVVQDQELRALKHQNLERANILEEQEHLRKQIEQQQDPEAHEQAQEEEAAAKKAAKQKAAAKKVKAESSPFGKKMWRR